MKNITRTVNQVISKARKKTRLPPSGVQMCNGLLQAQIENNVARMDVFICVVGSKSTSYRSEGGAPATPVKLTNQICQILNIMQLFYKLNFGIL